MGASRSWTMTAILFSALLAGACGKGEHEESKTGTIIPIVDKGFYGWDSLVLINQFVRMDVVPDLGGKIMGFDLQGYQTLWHNPIAEGVVDTTQGYGKGNFFNPGGAKVWPAPQGWGGEGEWPGPPDNVLDDSPYTAEYNGTTVTVTGPADTGPGRTGLQYRHTYTLVPSASMADLNLTMTNLVDRPVRWGLWHLATVPVDRPVTVYAPVSRNADWHVIYGDEDNPQWMGVEKGLFRARYDKRVGKVGLRTSKGWVAWHDEANNIAFVLQFPMERGLEYPDGGSTVELWTAGAGSINAHGGETTYEYDPDTALMEVEVMGPLTSLTPGAQASLAIRWGVCRCSGVTDVNEFGVIVEPLKLQNGKLTGRYGVFYGAKLAVRYLGPNDERLGMRLLGDVTPLTELVVNQEFSLRFDNLKKVQYILLERDDNTVRGILDEVTL